MAGFKPKMAECTYVQYSWTHDSSITFVLKVEPLFVMVCVKMFFYRNINYGFC